MSADGDIVRAALRPTHPQYDSALDALARLEAELLDLAEANEKLSQAWETGQVQRDALAADLQAERETVAEWARRVSSTEEQRDALAEALRKIATRLDDDTDSYLFEAVSTARAALAEAGLE